MPDIDFNYFTAIVSLTSLAISLCTAFYVFWKQRRNIVFKINDVSFVDFIDNPNGQLCVQMFFINKSQNPISINYIELKDSNNNTYICNLIPGLVKHKFSHLIDTDTCYQKFIESAQFPICLDSLSAKLEYVYFQIPIDHEIKKCTIYTNRGFPINYNDLVLSIGNCDHYRNGQRYKERDYSKP